MLGRLVRQHEHEFLLSAGLRPDDNEIAKPVSDTCLVLSTFAAQLGFDAAGAAFGCEALEFGIGD